MNKKLGLFGILLVSLSAVTLAGCSQSNQGASSKSSSTISSLKSENSSLRAENNSLQGIGTKGSSTRKTSSAKTTAFKAKTLNTVGEEQYTITSVKQAKVNNKESEYTDAEYNFDGIKSYPDKYYRAEITYRLKNIGTQDFDLSYGQDSVSDAQGLEYSYASGDVNGLNSNSNGVVKAGMTTSGTFYLISKTEIPLDHFSINISEQVPKGGEGTVGAAGTANY